MIKLVNDKFTKNKLKGFVQDIDDLKLTDSKDAYCKKIVRSLLSQDDLMDTPIKKKARVNNSDTTISKNSTEVNVQDKIPDINVGATSIVFSEKTNNETITDPIQPDKLAKNQVSSPNVAPLQHSEKEGSTQSRGSFVYSINEDEVASRELRSTITSNSCTKSNQSNITSTLSPTKMNFEVVLNQHNTKLKLSTHMRNLKGIKDNQVEDIVSFDMDTNLLLLGLLVVREPNVDSIIKNVQGVSDLKGDKYKCFRTNAVNFAPPANHHLVQHTNYSKEFIHKVYMDEGRYSITENNKIHIVLFRLLNCNEKPKSPKQSWKLESIFPVEYLNRNTGKTSTSAIYHGTKVGLPFRTESSETSYTNFENIVCLIEKFGHRDLRSSEHLQQFATTLDIDLSSFNRNKTELQNFNNMYIELSVKIQEKYELAIAIPEGLHRINLAVRAASGDSITNNYHIHEKNTFLPTAELLLLKTPLAEMCTVKMQLPFATLPSLDNLRVQSSHIRKGQNMGHKKTFVDALHACSTEFDRLFQDRYAAFSDKYKNLTKVNWYEHQTCPTLDRILNFNYKSIDKKSPRKAQKDIYKKEQAEALKELHSSYETYDDEKGPYVHIASITLPCVFVIINDYFHHEHRFKGSRTVSDTKQDAISTKMFDIFTFLQLGGYDKTLVMNSEYAKTGNMKQLNVEFRTRVILQFLRYMFLFKSNRSLLEKYSFKNVGCRKWTQIEQPNEDNYVSVNFYEYEFIAKLMETTSAATALVFDYLEKTVMLKKNIFRKKKINSIVFESLLSQLMESVLMIGPSPQLDMSQVSQKLGNKLMSKHIENNQLAKTQILSVLLDLYSGHVRKYLKTLPALEKHSFFSLKDCFDSLPPRNNSDSTRESLRNKENPVTKDHFRLKDFKLPITTRKGFSGYILDVNTVIPGSFYNFCRSIGCSENAPVRYKTFNIEPYEEKKPIESVEISEPDDDELYEETLLSEGSSVEDVRSEDGIHDEASFRTPTDMLVGISKLFKKNVNEYKQTQEVSVSDFFIDTLGLFKSHLVDQDLSPGYQAFEDEVKQFMATYIPRDLLQTTIRTDKPLLDNTETKLPDDTETTVDDNTETDA